MKIKRILPKGRKEKIDSKTLAAGDIFEYGSTRFQLKEISYEDIFLGQRFRGSDGRWRYRYDYAGQKTDCFLDPDTDPLGSEGIVMSVDLHSPGQHLGKKVIAIAEV